MQETMSADAYVLPFDQLRMQDVGQVGGKNASLGEMITQLEHLGVRVPGGFATTAAAYRDFLAQSGLTRRIEERLAALDVSDVKALAAAGAQIREWIVQAPLPARLDSDIRLAFEELCRGLGGDPSFAVRSSATAEDLPEASFAGQQETYLNVRGWTGLERAIRDCMASLYTDRAIAYRAARGIDHRSVALSVGVQRMVRSDLACAGVVFTLDTESGFRDVVLVTGAWGLGEAVVQGRVNPDEFWVHKPTLAAGHRPLLRRELKEQHDVLRELLDACEALAYELDRGEATANQLSREVSRLRRAFDAHNAFEEQLLRPALLGADAFAEVRLDRMIDDHVREHRAMRAQFNHTETGALREAVEMLRAHLDAEERYLLSAHVLRDDVVSIEPGA